MTYADAVPQDGRLVLVMGGTGTLGRLVARRLLDAGRSVRVLSRHPVEADPAVEHVAADLERDAGIARPSKARRSSCTAPARRSATSSRRRTW